MTRAGLFPRRTVLVVVALVLVGCSSPAASPTPSGAASLLPPPSAIPSTRTPAPAPTATDAAPTSAPTSTPQPSPTQAAAEYTVLGWSTASKAIDDQDPTKAPSKLVRSGGTIAFCGKERLVFWVSRTGHDAASTVYLTLKRPGGELVRIKPRKYVAPDGVIALAWGYTSRTFDARDKGTYTATVAVGDRSTVVAKGTVKAAC